MTFGSYIHPSHSRMCRIMFRIFSVATAICTSMQPRLVPSGPSLVQLRTAFFFAK